jgi:5-methylcytosine-specific restriction endonuclease McrA
MIYKGNEKEYMRAYYQKNKKDLLSKKKKWYYSPDGNKKVKAWGKTSKAKKYQMAYRKKRKEHYKKLYRSWSRSLEGRLNKRIRQRNRAQKLKDLSLQTVQLVYEANIRKYGRLTCYLCLIPIEFGTDHLEHKTPLSRGGTNAFDNLDVACRSCNCKKHAKTLEEYLCERK